MKILILVDKIITDDELDELQRRFTDFIYENTGIDPTYFVEEKDYKNYPVYTDADGDIRPHNVFLRETAKDVHRRYSGEGTDHVVLLIHEDHWKSPTIWGTAYANVYSGYQLHYCRLDRDNETNSFNTLFHEYLHPIDALVKTYTGVDLNSLVEANLRKTYWDNGTLITYLDRNGFDWDRDFVHGGLRPPFGYIGRRGVLWQDEVGRILQLIAPLLVESYQKRDKIYQEKIGKMKTIVTILTQIVALLRQQFNKKSGVTK